MNPLVITNAEIMLIRLLLQNKLGSKNKVFFINVDNCNYHQIKDIIQSNYENNENKYSYYVYMQFINGVSMGHWILTVYIINGREERVNEIRIYNSLPETTPRNYQFHLAYPNTPLYVVEGLPIQKGLDCGYWSLFYAFIVFLTPESLDMISKLKGIIK